MFMRCNEKMLAFATQLDKMFQMMMSMTTLITGLLSQHAPGTAQASKPSPHSLNSTQVTVDSKSACGTSMGCPTRLWSCLFKIIPLILCWSEKHTPALVHRTSTSYHRLWGSRNSTTSGRVLAVCI